uniref:Immunoglobulin V-set domain-containing protein n=1 Tax=Sinocyclocheilus rhinocerous TaxID=307959 RepID=A0A673NI83_9TELE
MNHFEQPLLPWRGSGFTFGSYDMQWVRQQPRKALVWMGRVWYNGQGHDYAGLFKGTLEITRDDSKSMMYLKLSGLTEEDSAVYFCARDTVTLTYGNDTKTGLDTYSLKLQFSSVLVGCTSNRNKRIIFDTKLMKTNVDCIVFLYHMHIARATI